ncbi:MAG: adenylosuccinate synthase [Verrucomicrobiota bacterium]|nr:adenylosuccinate synthase [Verrucomicrobiota bacterium]
MPITALVGAQWGDEGKGKIIDVLTEEADMVVRYQGGNNAGHTVKIGDETHILHLVPSGVFRPQTVCVIGNGVVVDPLALLKEMADIQSRGVTLKNRLFVSDRAHVVFPYHRALDETRETQATDIQKIGTTKRGIGPCYGDKVSRVGLRIADLVDPGFRAIARRRIEEANRILEALGAEPFDSDRMIEDYTRAARQIAPYVTDSVALINRAAKEGRSILFEGAQGAMLDIDFGTYPYVTSSNGTAGGVCTGAGIAPHRIDRVIGVVKAYTTRVGQGPFPTELTDEVGKLLGREGQEFGATTGRPRRCGWFDAVVARYAAMINGVDFWAITKLDVLDSLATIRIGVAYECDGETRDTIPANIRMLERCRPVYEEVEGWQTSTGNATRYEDLPERAKAYVNRLCELTGVKMGLLSVGPRRESTLRLAV